MPVSRAPPLPRAARIDQNPTGGLVADAGVLARPLAQRPFEPDDVPAHGRRERARTAERAHSLVHPALRRHCGSAGRHLPTRRNGDALPIRDAQRRRIHEIVNSAETAVANKCERVAFQNAGERREMDDA